MALLHWRKFAFFDEEYVVDTELNQLVTQEKPKDVIEDGKPFVTVKLSCSSSGRGAVLLGDNNGYAYIINKQLEVNSFKANQKFTSHIKQVPKLSLFLTAGSDQNGVNPIIKIWDLEKTDRLNQPTCLRVIRANSGFIKPSPITAIECNDNLTLMAVGYGDGSIVLFHGDITRQRRSKFSRPIKVSEHPITAIVIRGETRTEEPASSSYLTGPTSKLETTAFVSTREEVFFANLSDKSFSKVQLDQLGCEPKCCCLVSTSETKGSGENLFAVGRQNAVYFYQMDGRGPCLAFDGDKLALYRFKTYLVMISLDQPRKNDTNPILRPRPFATIDNLGDTNLISSKRFNLNIYDIKNKYIAHSSVVPDIDELFSDWGQLYAICKNGRVLVFREKDTQTKLETLFKKNQFSLVIDIAKSHDYNEDALTDIFKHYGDHLYRKGDFDGSVTQYIKTIGRSEPSYVIKKFLDSKRISYLTVYLEALHKNFAASPDHTKLLLNCYSKLRNDQQLKQFIESYEGGNLQFDVDIAIKVLRDAGFYEFALYLAKKYQKHEFFFKVQIEDEGNCEAALGYMDEMIDPANMAHYMKRYGRAMLKEAPERTILMIKEICRRSFETTKDRVQGIAGPFDFHNIPHQIYPDEFFHIFVHNNELFVQLLEQLVEDSAEYATKAVYNLLLELYLNSWRRERDDIMRQLQADKIKKLLSEPKSKFDIEQALILCRNNRFDEGLMMLYGRAKLYHLVLQYHIDQDDSLLIMKTCETYGQDNPNLYMPALIHYSKTGDERLAQLLKAIEHHNVIPPMVVIKILLDSKRASLGSVKDYMVRYLSRLNDRQLDNENAIDHYKDDTEVVRQRIEEFENHQTVFKPSKCSACQDILDLPSVHFLCSHSYHQNCFHNYSAEADECPICVGSNRKLLDEISSHETSKTTLEELGTELGTTATDDVFNSLAKLFGYGLFRSSERANQSPLPGGSSRSS